MKIAALSDVHGNLPAFEAALDHVERQNVDAVVIVGDVLMGAPDDLACWQLACKQDAIVQGNTEYWAGQYGTADADSIWGTEQFGPLRWAAEQFTTEQRKTLADLPLTYKVPEVEDVLFCHAAPSGFERITAYTPEEQLQRMFAGYSEPFIVRGHQHSPQVRIWGNRKIINCGSIGVPVDMNPTAQYLIVEQRAGGWHIQHQSVIYDVEETHRRFKESGYLEAAGPLGRLFMRQTLTATSQVSVFLTYYKQWATEADLTLSAAVDRFLNLY